MKRETLFLKVAVILMGIPVLALCIFFVPAISNFMAELYPETAYLHDLLRIGLYAAAIPFYIALYQTFKLLVHIDQNKSFSELSLKSLKNIKYCATAISILYVLNMPLFYLMAKRVDPPIIMPIGYGVIFAALVIAVFAAVLQKLVKHAIDIKSENDLTV
ncbi:DUF2975 domain-containing protein [Tumebacillus permanentifrigoris]|uniref:DUF2975 family protein n=1 Tax=Tumebacillus permanentifrigoris TaxID=378543 RepID=A0A316D7Q3_9BACL|nr:DUF2975 domain-containing protein [Tumebacillus permanentifrigoris]PWK09611.1 hypothetical protein C7459_11345 [Tumebacillus permanentifrigoris]